MGYSNLDAYTMFTLPFYLIGDVTGQISEPVEYVNVDPAAQSL
ncbi:hypothetical protein [Paenibacillus sp. sgz5001063]